MGLKIDLKKREIERKKRLSGRKKNNGSKIINRFLSLMLRVPIISSVLQKESKSVVLKKYKVESSKIQSNIDILFISDLHLEVVDNVGHVETLLLNKSYDYIVLGGDLFDKDDVASENKVKFENLINLLKEKSKNEVISIMGNHDGLNTSELLDKKTRLLINDYVDGDDVFIYGTEDPVLFEDTIDYQGSIPSEKFSILLSHSPNFYKNIKNNYDLMLSGHTHGGQVSIFNYAPLNYCYDKKMVYGDWMKNGMRGITSSGLGCSGLPVRIGVYPEIVEINVSKK